MTGPERRIPVLVVLPPRVLLLDLAGPMEVLRIAGSVQDRIAFELSYAAPQGSIRSSIGLDLGGAGPLPPEIAPGTVVLLPGATDRPLGPERDRAAEAAAEAQIVAWLRTAIRPGHTVVTVCEGALPAARAGLFDGYACTTHHGSCARLQTAAPHANVLENRLFVQDRDRFSSAGVTAGIDLMLHLVAEWAGPATAIAVARTLVVYMRRGPDDPQLSPWLEGRSHLHPVVHRAQDAIAADPVRDWSPAALGKLVGASPRNLARLFRLQAGMTVTEAVNRARIARARDLIAQTDLGLEHVAERAGFASARHMRRVWGQFHATAPSVLRAKVPVSKGRALSRVQGSALMGSGEARHRGQSIRDSAPIPRQRARPLETHDGKPLDSDDRL